MSSRYLIALILGRHISAAVIAFAVVLQNSPSIADGALAIGLPADGARAGFTAGEALNAPDMDAARKLAVDDCRNRGREIAPAATKLCKVVATFRNQCFGVALDPKVGTPGVGWAIAESQDKAEEQAIVQCRTTAGVGRQQFCVISQGHGCDGTAK